MVKKVLKFGGTSVGTIERIQHVAKIIKKEYDLGNKLIVVVSAMAGKTNELIDLIKFLKTLIKGNLMFYYLQANKLHVHYSRPH